MLTFDVVLKLTVVVLFALAAFPTGYKVACQWLAFAIAAALFYFGG